MREMILFGDACREGSKAQRLRGSEVGSLKASKTESLKGERAVSSNRAVAAAPRRANTWIRSVIFTVSL
jgi:hypothetical protein